MDARIGDERAVSFSVRDLGSRRQDNAPALPSTEINCTKVGVLQRFVFRDIDGNTRATEAVCAEHAAQHHEPPKWQQIEPQPIQAAPSEKTTKPNSSSRG